ncbi:MAG: hypothetical protein RL329_4050 [Bacteroidota bacterium]|jgi:undecaprenyl-diphosphatase
MTYLQAIILAIVEGITEYLPVSSTGHMVITSSLMGIGKSEFTKLFEVVIQMGAILSVLVLYWKRFLQNFNFYLKLAVAFLPAAVFGLLFYKHIKALLENPITIAVVLLLGGVVLLFVDQWFAKNEQLPQKDEPDFLTAFKIGCFQVLSMLLPGLSRSAATIIGGLTQGLNREKAAEFAFFLAVPTMAAASAKSGLEYYKDVKKGILPALTQHDMVILAIGNLVAFVVAMIAIKTFIGFLNQNGFKMFGYYRIIIGLLILGLQFAGVQLFL